MERELIALQARVDELERKARRWRTGSLAAGAALTAVLCAAAAPVVCDVLTGERLIVRDESGRTRVTLDAYRTDAPALAFQDKDGKVRARLGLDASGATTLSTYDAQGKLAHTERFGAPTTGEGGSGAGRAEPKKPATEPATTTTVRYGGF